MRLGKALATGIAEETPYEEAPYEDATEVALQEPELTEPAEHAEVPAVR
ncbi:hypothetical protein V2W30_09530 [Streptomyces sp. Q6]|uniref:Uncharacterized protein n=1 Tax=Streptomyces citrinus TaxID=3118173 RepID=A0ACD5A8Y8_9ACTN